MTDLTSYGAEMLARALCGRTPPLPTYVFAALGTDGNRAQGVTGEPRGTGYARQRVTFSGDEVQANADALWFTFSGIAGLLTHIGLFDAAVGGNALTFSRLAAPVEVTGPGTVNIPVGALTVSAESEHD